VVQRRGKYAPPRLQVAVERAFSDALIAAHPAPDVSSQHSRIFATDAGRRFLELGE
jgi:hypothetical protein